MGGGSMPVCVLNYTGSGEGMALTAQNLANKSNALGVQWESAPGTISFLRPTVDDWIA